MLSSHVKSHYQWFFSVLMSFRSWRHKMDHIFTIETFEITFYFVIMKYLEILGVRPIVLFVRITYQFLVIFLDFSWFLVFVTSKNLCKYVHFRILTTFRFMTISRIFILNFRKMPLFVRFVWEFLVIFLDFSWNSRNCDVTKWVIISKFQISEIFLVFWL